MTAASAPSKPNADQQAPACQKERDLRHQQRHVRESTARPDRRARVPGSRFRGMPVTRRQRNRRGETPTARVVAQAGAGKFRKTPRPVGASTTPMATHPGSAIAPRSDHSAMPSMDRTARPNTAHASMAARPMPRRRDPPRPPRAQSTGDQRASRCALRRTKAATTPTTEHNCKYRGGRGRKIQANVGVGEPANREHRERRRIGRTEDQRDVDNRQREGDHRVDRASESADRPAAGSSSATLRRARTRASARSARCRCAGT